MVTLPICEEQEWGSSSVSIGTRGYQFRYCGGHIWPNATLIGCREFELEGMAIIIIIIRVVELLSALKPSFPFTADLGQVPEHPSPNPSSLLQSSSQPTPLVCLSPPKPLPWDTRPLPRREIGPFHDYSLLNCSLLFSRY